MAQTMGVPMGSPRRSDVKLPDATPKLTLEACPREWNLLHFSLHGDFP
jgi:hypothetical protein